MVDDFSGFTRIELEYLELMVVEDGEEEVAVVVVVGEEARGGEDGGEVAVLGLILL